MEKFRGSICSILFAAAALIVLSNSYAAAALKVVGLYSETDAGHVEIQKGGKWKAVSVGDKIPLTAVIRITVDRDWVELSPDDNPNAVYEIDGSSSGTVIKKISDLSKQKAKVISFPKKGGKEAKMYSGTVVVMQYLGRQFYRVNDDSRWVELKYGDKLDKGGTVNIIGINNTLSVAYPNGEISNIIGPIRFKVEKLFSGQNLYKYLNVTE